MSVPFHIFNQGSFVPNAVTGVSVSVDNVGDKVKATWTAPTTGRYPYGYKVMFSNAVTSGGTYSLFNTVSSGPAPTTTLDATVTPSFSNFYSVGVYSSNIENRLSPVTFGSAVQFGLAAKAVTLGTIQTLTDGSVDVNWTSNVSLAQPTQQLVVRFYNAAASYDDNTNPIALTGANYNTGVNVTTNGLNQLVFNTAYTIYVLTSNTINNTTYTSSAASSAITFGATAIAATPGTINTLSDGSIDVNWTSNVTTARPTQGLRVLFTTGAGYYDYTDLIALSGTNYNTGTNGTNAGLVQLAFNTAYTISILTSNAINSSFTPSTTSTATFGAFAFAAGGITNAATQSDGSITVSWTAYSGTVARPNGNTYIGVNGGQTSGLGASAATYNTGTAGNGSSIPQLTFNTTYEFFVQTSNALNGATPTSVSAGSAKFGTVPIAPTISSTSTGNGSITINLTAPSTTTARPRTGYTYSLSGQAVVSANSASSSYTFTGLANGTYNVSVVAYNDIGNSSAATSTGIAVVIVTAPTIGSVRISSSKTVTVNFSGGTGVSTYNLYLDDTLITSGISSGATTTTFAVGSYSLNGAHTLKMKTAGTSFVSDFSNTATYIYYDSTNAVYSYYIPSSTVSFAAAGGGGGGASKVGGAGGFIQISATITARTVYLVVADGGGANGTARGTPGGGAGAAHTAGGGGGYSIITDQTNNTINANFTLIAGGGGGGGWVSGGGQRDESTAGAAGGGSTGATADGIGGWNMNLAGGGGGGQSSGGNNNIQLTGGGGGDSSSGRGGGGGGGWYGGGGGQSQNSNDPYYDGWNVERVNRYFHGGCGGGGGSSYYSPSWTLIDNTQGAGGAGGGGMAIGTDGFIFISHI